MTRKRQLKAASPLHGFVTGRHHDHRALMQYDKLLPLSFG
ncbi:hypothetical protein CEV33_1999 [Brucella grignonensis]|uniref:Uncharacterized protein n=1 Tax=Brucella grignonensis TaxID=94627 RepID=A0A256F6P4_9HYPH|nr:hypothetical protein CEV33_1999 [Brucella grignonensis]